MTRLNHTIKYNFNLSLIILFISEKMLNIKDVNGRNPTNKTGMK